MGDRNQGQAGLGDEPHSLSRGSHPAGAAGREGATSLHLNAAELTDLLLSEAADPMTEAGAIVDAFASLPAIGMEDLSIPVAPGGGTAQGSVRVRNLVTAGARLRCSANGLRG
jgi:hypothetical protein